MNRTRYWKVAVGGIALLTALYGLAHYWRGYLPEYVEQGVFAYQVYISPLLIALVIVAALYLMEVFKPQEKPLSLLPAVALGWVLVAVTDTPVWGVCENWRGSCVVPGALILLEMLTIELVWGVFGRKKRGFSVKSMLLTLGMMVCACLPILEYWIGLGLLDGMSQRTLFGSAWVLRMKTAITYTFYLAGGTPLIPYLKRRGDAVTGIVLLLIGLSGPVVSLVSNLGGLYEHVLYASIAEWVTLSAFSAVAVAGIVTMCRPPRHGQKDQLDKSGN